MIALYTLLSNSPNIRKISIMLNETGLMPYLTGHSCFGDGKRD